MLLNVFPVTYLVDFLYISVMYKKQAEGPKLDFSYMCALVLFGFYILQVKKLSNIIVVLYVV